MKELHIPRSFKIDEYYTNDQIQYSLDVGNSGGIRPKLNSVGGLDFVVLITSREDNKKASRNPYADKIEYDVLTYTAAGLTGEQGISGVNKRIIEQENDHVPILCFVKESTNKYKFTGFLFLLRHYTDFQLDKEGSMRKVIIFEFKIISKIPELFVGNFRSIFLPIYSALQKDIIKEDTIVTETADEKVEDGEIGDLKRIEELKAKLILVDPYVFEVIISKLVDHVGFNDVKVTKKSGDDGVDVNAVLKNPISTDLVFLFQVKRWKHSVGRNEVANLRGSMGLNNQGVIISTSHFTLSAINEASSEFKIPINLIGIHDLYKIIKTTGFDIEKHLA